MDEIIARIEKIEDRVDQIPSLVIDNSEFDSRLHTLEKSVETLMSDRELDKDRELSLYKENLELKDRISKLEKILK